MTAIRLSSTQHTGTLLRSLRNDSGLTLRELSKRLHVGRSALSHREIRSGLSICAFVEHVAALGYDVALIPRDLEDA